MFKNRLRWTWCLLTMVTLGLTLPVAAVDSNPDDQSDNPNDPTLFQLQKGDNHLTATTMAGDMEFVTLNIPDAHAITEIRLESYIAEFDHYMFIAIQTGTRFKLVGETPAEETLVGWSYFGPDYRDNGVASLGTNEVSVSINSPNVEEVVGQLTERDYTIMLQQDGDLTTYTLNFIVGSTTAVTTSSITSTPSHARSLILIFALFALSTLLLHKVSRSDHGNRR